MNNRAALNLGMYIIGILFFVMVIVGFYTIPNQGFWQFHNYTAPTNNLSLLDKSSELNSLSTNMSKDVMGINETQTSIGTSVSIIDSFIKQAGGALVTVYNSFGMSKTLIEYTFGYLQLPPEITALITTAVLILILFSLMYIIFGRSDV